MNSEKLNKILTYAKKNVPYYNNLNLKENCSIDRFPIITKEILRDNYSKFISNKIKTNNIFVEYTTGSTGIPMKCIKSKKEMFISQKQIWSWRANNVFRVFEKKLLVFSNDIQLKSQLNKFGENSVNNYYGNIQYKYITPRDLQELNINDIIAYINDYKPNWIRSTPSNLYYFCKKLEDSSLDIKLNNIEFIELSGETVEKYHIEMFKKFFSCFIGNHYGCREVWPIACQCKYGQLHVFEDHVYCETINNSKYGKDVGELCITSLNQYSFPYIRYNIGDIVSLKHSVCKCGRSGLVIKKLYGRSSDTICIDGKCYTPQIFTQPIKKMVSKNMINPRRFIIVEKNENNFTLYIEQTIKCNKKIKKTLFKYFKEYISPKVKLKILFCDKIPIDLENKNKYFIKYSDS